MQSLTLSGGKNSKVSRRKVEILFTDIYGC